MFKFDSKMYFFKLFLFYSFIQFGVVVDVKWGWKTIYIGMKKRLLVQGTVEAYRFPMSNR